MTTLPPLPGPGLRFHHVGVVSPDLDKDTTALGVLGYRPEGPDFVDPVQGVRGRFLGGVEPRLELLAPLAEAGVLAPWMKTGAKLYHLAYEARDPEAVLETLRAGRGRVLVPPVPAVAFHGRAISFVMLPNLLLVELISSS